MDFEKINEGRSLKSYHVLDSDETPRINKLLDIYSKDKRKAKIYSSNNGNRFYSNKTILFEYDNGDINVVSFQKMFSMTKNNKIYSREKPINRLTYNNKTHKMYIISGKIVRQATISLIVNFFKDMTMQYMVKKLSWLRNIYENETLHFISLNTIYTKKLFNEKKVFKHFFDLPYPVSKDLIYGANKNYFSLSSFKKHWNGIKDVLINKENLTAELFFNNIFSDSVRMANLLGYKVNCSWSKRRLKEMHDKWSNELTDIELEFEEFKELKVSKIYQKFAEFSGLKLLTNNFDLIKEGKKMKHCVATYISKVNFGKCGIYSLGDYTLELNYGQHNIHEVNDPKSKEFVLYINQLRGFSNISAPKVLYDNINNLVSNFNEKIKYDFELIDEVNKENKKDEDVDWLF